MATRKLLAFDPNEGYPQELAVGDDASIGKIVFTGVGGVAVDAGGFDITNLPATPGGASSAVARSYVDNLAQGVAWKNPVRAATTAPLPACTYANGASGVGATL